MTGTSTPGIAFLRKLRIVSQPSPAVLSHLDQRQATLDAICALLGFPPTAQWTTEQLEGAARFFALASWQHDPTVHTFEDLAAAVGSIGNRITQLAEAIHA